MLTHSHLCPSYFSLILASTFTDSTPHPASMHSLKPRLIASRHSQPHSAPSACLHHTHSYGGIPAHSHVGWYLLESFSVGLVAQFQCFLLFRGGGGCSSGQHVWLQNKVSDTCLGEKKYTKQSRTLLFFQGQCHFLSSPPSIEMLYWRGTFTM